jgi:hypothetical protein
MRGTGIVPLKSSLRLTASSIVFQHLVAAFKHSLAEMILQFAIFVVFIAIFVTCFSIPEHSFAKTTLQFAAFVVFIAVFVTCFLISEHSFAAFEHGSTPHTLIDSVTQGNRISQPDTIAVSMLQWLVICDDKSSVEYAKAGGSNRKKGGRSTLSTTINPMATTTAIAPTQAVPLNGNGAQPVLN